jgi:beta-glucosidase
VKELNRLLYIAMEKSRLHIPLIIGFDVIHGYRTIFPVPLAMASSWDPAVEEAAQHQAAQDARAAGIQWTFAPMVDIARDALWGRIVEGAGEDPYLGAIMAQVRCFRDASIGPDSVLACVKHFAGYDAADGGRDYDSSYIPEVLFRNVYMAPSMRQNRLEQVLHECLYGFERCANQRRPLTTAGHSAPEVGLQGICSL